MRQVLSSMSLAVVMLGSPLTASMQAPVPTPRPFPGAGAPSQPPAAPRPGDAAAPQPPPPVAPAPPPGVPVYPTAEYLETLDAGSGQSYVLYGTNVPYADIVNYYRTALKTGGRELFRAPATHQFDLGRFQQERMAYPPSVVVKDYTWNNSPGYSHVTGATEKRFKTIIQIVAAGPTP